jgi:hypothetical protein
MWNGGAEPKMRARDVEESHQQSHLLTSNLGRKIRTAHAQLLDPLAESATLTKK